MDNLTVESVISVFGGGDGPDAIKATAKKLGIRPQAIYGWRRRGSIPRDVALICHFSHRHPYQMDCERYRLSPDLLSQGLY